MSDQIGYDKPCFLYRYYNSDGALLYAGIATDVERRRAEHCLSKNWAAEIARVEADEYPSRWRAALAERAVGTGRYGWLPGGIGKRMAALLTGDELREVVNSPVYAGEGAEAIARRWGMRVGRIRELRAHKR